jgi:hypothetical protein
MRGDGGDIEAVVLAIVGRVREAVDPDLKPRNEYRREDVCSAIRDKKFTEHQAHVAAVMAIREAGTPAFAVSGADHAHEHLIAVRTAPLRWRVVDLLAAAPGFFDVPPPLLARADGLRTFPYAAHELWDPRGGAYYAGAENFAKTEWVLETWGAPRFTRVVWHSLGETCS